MEVKMVKIQIVLIAIVAVCLFLPLNAMGSGYQEEKLFDGNFYTQEDLRKKIEVHGKELQVLKNQIKTLETDVDWLVLKINTIEDAGRTAPYNLKDSISAKEKKIATLNKSKNRLKYLVQYYTAMLDSSKKRGLDEIIRKKVPAPTEKTQPDRQRQASAEQTPAKPTAQSVTGSVFNDEDSYDGVSKIELEKAVKKAGLGDWLEIVGTGSCLRIETTLPILFPTGSAKVAGEYKGFLKKLAEFLKPYDVKVLVTGYADKIPIHNKKYPSNFELGATRAANIVHQFVQNGLKPSIFRIESTGKHRFAAKQLSPQKSLERRAEVTVIFSG